MTGRFGAGPLRGISALLLLRAVTAASLLAALHALRVERTADDLVADAGEVLHPAAAHEHDRVLLQVVADSRDVRRHLDAAGEADAGDLAQCGVGLLGRGRVDAGADAAPLRAALEGRRLGLLDLVLAALADQLLDGGHEPPSVSVSCCVVLGCLLGAGRTRVDRPTRSGVSSRSGPLCVRGTHRSRSRCALRPDGFPAEAGPAEPGARVRAWGDPRHGERAYLSLRTRSKTLIALPGGAQPGVTTVGALGLLLPSSTDTAMPRTTASTTTPSAVR